MPGTYEKGVAVRGGNLTGSEKGREKTGTGVEAKRLLSESWPVTGQPARSLVFVLSIVGARGSPCKHYVNC